MKKDLFELAKVSRWEPEFTQICLSKKRKEEGFMELRSWAGEALEKQRGVIPSKPWGDLTPGLRWLLRPGS